MADRGAATDNDSDNEIFLINAKWLLDPCSRFAQRRLQLAARSRVANFLSLSPEMYPFPWADWVTCLI